MFESSDSLRIPMYITKCHHRMPIGCGNFQKVAVIFKNSWMNVTAR
jgi:hypothetical protein